MHASSGFKSTILSRLMFFEGMKMSKPFLKWAGGKYKLVPFIENNFHKTAQRKRLIEPFCGSAALSLALEFDEYLFN